MSSNPVLVPTGNTRRTRLGALADLLNKLQPMADARTTRLLRTLHATAVVGPVVIGIYLYVPRFVGMFALFGSDLPFSARVLMSAYPFAIVLPFGTTACALMLRANSPWRRWFMPSVYVMSIGLGCFVLWALYAPVLMLSGRSAL